MLSFLDSSPLHSFCYLPAVQVCVFQPGPEGPWSWGNAGFRTACGWCWRWSLWVQKQIITWPGQRFRACHCTGQHLRPVPHEALSVMQCGMDIQRLQLTAKSGQFPLCLALEPGLSISTKDWASLRYRDIFEWGMEAVMREMLDFLLIGPVIDRHNKG